MVRRAALQVASWIDSESVRHYQAVIYTTMIIAGMQMAILRKLPSAVGQALGAGFNVAFVVLTIISPLITLCARRWLADRLAGLQLQFAGDIGVVGALGVYAYCVRQPPWGDKATFSFWMILGLTVCAGLIVARDIRRIRVAGAMIRDAVR